MSYIQNCKRYYLPNVSITYGWGFSHWVERQFQFIYLSWSFFCNNNNLFHLDTIPFQESVFSFLFFYSVQDNFWPKLLSIFSFIKSYSCILWVLYAMSLSIPVSIGLKLIWTNMNLIFTKFKTLTMDGSLPSFSS